MFKKEPKICEECGELYFEITTKNGKVVPMDITPVDPKEYKEGTLLWSDKLGFDKAEWIVRMKKPGPWYITHWKTCNRKPPYKDEVRWKKSES